MLKQGHIGFQINTKILI